MERAIITAPVARDLRQDYPTVSLWMIPGATNGTVQAWDTNDMDTLRALAISRGDTQGFNVYNTRAEVPAVLKPYLILVRRSDSSTALVNTYYKRLAECGAADYFRVRVLAGNVVVKQKSTMLATDKPTEWLPAHLWCEIADALGEN